MHLSLEDKCLKLAANSLEFGAWLPDRLITSIADCLGCLRSPFSLVGSHLPSPTITALELSLEINKQQFSTLTTPAREGRLQTCLIP